MKRKFKTLSKTLCFLLIGMMGLQCQIKDDQPSSIITEAHQVLMNEDDRSVGKLKYLEHEVYRGERLLKTEYYDENNELTGTQYYEYEEGDLPVASKYYDVQDVLLSAYKFKNEGGVKVEARAYGGDGKQLYRIENYGYNDDQVMVSKEIRTANNIKDRTFLLDVDANGNETKMTVLESDDKVLLTETYEITQMDSLKRWVERWGYLNDDVQPTTYYKRSYGKRR